MNANQNEPMKIKAADILDAVFDANVVVSREALTRENNNKENGEFIHPQVPQTIKFNLEGLRLKDVIDKALARYVVDYQNGHARQKPSVYLQYTKKGDRIIAKQPVIEIKVAEFFRKAEPADKMVQVRKGVRTANADEIEQMEREIELRKRQLGIIK